MADSDMDDASTWWLGHIGAALINSKVVAVFNALRARLKGVGPMASGVATATPVTANTTVSVSVSFPTGRFATAPKVALGANIGSSNASSIFSSAWVTGLAATGFTLNVNRSNTTPVTVSWIAALTS